MVRDRKTTQLSRLPVRDLFPTWQDGADLEPLGEGLAPEIVALVHNIREIRKRAGGARSLFTRQGPCEDLVPHAEIVSHLAYPQT